MLFKRLYNWIKYKTLPTSFLFKNRLFIERDSKHRRIYNLFGTIFRNSKWSNYEFSNLKAQLKLKFIYFLYRSAVWAGVFLGYCCKRYFNEIDFFSLFFFLGWSCFEFFDYLAVFVVWLSLFIVYAVLNWVYTYFLASFFTITLDKPDFNARRFFNHYNQKAKDKVNKDIISSFEIDAYFFSWVCNLDDKHQIQKFSSLYKTQLNRKEWTQKYHYFRKLYKTIYFFNLLSINFSIPKKTGTLNFFSFKQNTFSYKIQHLMSSTNLLRLLFQNHMDNQKQTLNIYTTVFSTIELYNWAFNYSTIYDQSNHINKIAGPFYLSNLSFNEIHAVDDVLIGLSPFVDLLKNQILTTKWDRWLYRYSVLHRRLLKNSHKITITKRLLQSGYYDDRLVPRNPWMNHRASKLKKNLTTNLNALYYTTFFNSSVTKTWIDFSIKNNTKLNSTLQMTKFSYYENSFFWFVKRFYFFNTLKNNNVKTIKQKNNNSFKWINPKTLQHYYVLESSASLFKPVAKTFTLKSDHFMLDHYTAQSLASLYFLKDLFLFIETTELFTDSSLDTFSYIVTNSVLDNSTPSLFFFDFNTISGLENKKTFFSLTNTAIQLNLANSIFFEINNNITKLDLITLLLFLNTWAM